MKLQKVTLKAKVHGKFSKDILMKIKENMRPQKSYIKGKYSNLKLKIWWYIEKNENIKLQKVTLKTENLIMIYQGKIGKYEIT